MLNDLKAMHKIDPDGIVELLEKFPKQLSEGRRLAQEADISSIEGRDFDKIVVCGMGGSAIGGELVRSYVIDRLPIPVFINRDYSLPAFVDKSTLVIGSSYSGNTEETLSAFAQAEEIGSSLVAITTGGSLGDIVRKKGYPLIVLPSGLPPRAALGYSFTPILTIFERLGLIEDQSEAVRETAALLEADIEEYRPETSWENNPAKSLATILHGSLPLIYSDDWHFNAVAVRFRGQINENAKQLAYSAVLPENNHNELVGWKILGSISSLISGVFLEDREMNPRIRFRMNFLRETQEELGVQTISMQSHGKSLLARMFSLIQLGDWTSYYMAILNRENPMPVDVIDKLKAALKEL